MITSRHLQIAGLVMLALFAAQFVHMPARAQRAGQPRLVAQLGHSGSIVDVAFSPDGRFVLTGGLDDNICLWDAATGDEIHRFSIPGTYVYEGVSFSPDGRFISSDQGFDDLDLMSYVRKRLEEESYAAPRGQATAEVVFVEADELPGAIRPFGQYRVEGNRIRVSVNLVRDGQKVSGFVAEGQRSDTAGLAVMLVKLIAEAIRGIR